MNPELALLELETELTRLNATRPGRRAFLAALPLLVTACATGGKGRSREGDNTGQAAALTPDDERKMTQEVLPKMQQEYPPIQNPELQGYISKLGASLVAANKLDANPYRYSFTVVGVPYVNAFALPAGTVFVTAPLIQMADTEAELMGVVGHEVGHIKARHTAERMEAAKKAEKGSLWYGIAGGLLGGAAGFGLGKLLCKGPNNTTECMAKATALGAAAGAGGGLLIQKFAFMANSREDEMEADRIGFRTSLASGYHKDHVGLFYAKLLKMEEASQKSRTPVLSSFADAMSTHPPSRERVAQMSQMASESSKSASAKISSKEFDRAKKIASEWVAANPPKA
jgi:predicted Zn-dependent protease